jgi:hypothetical protein
MDLASWDFFQKAEIIPLIGTLTLGKDKRPTINTNSKYAFLVLHVHAAKWKERGLFSGKESPIKHGNEIPVIIGYPPTKKVAVIR